MKTRKFLSPAFFSLAFGGIALVQKSVMIGGAKMLEFYCKIYEKTSFIYILGKSHIFR